MMKSPNPQRAKSRMRGDRPKVTVREQCDHEDISHQQRLSHTSGQFDADPSYTGHGVFGFSQTDMT